MEETTRFPRLRRHLGIQTGAARVALHRGGSLGFAAFRELAVPKSMAVQPEMDLKTQYDWFIT